MIRARNSSDAAVPVSDRVSLATVSEWPCLDPTGWSWHEYSLMKHGHIAAASNLARLLATRLADTRILEMSSGGTLWITSPPFAAIPSASHYLARDFAHACRRLSHLEPHAVTPKYFPLRKDHQPSSTDYAALGRSQRERAQHDQAGSIRRPPLELGRNRLVVVNDVRVTGAQESSLASLLAQYWPAAEIRWVYLAEVESGLASNPQVEQSMNLVGMESTSDFIEFVGTNDIRLTARMVRRALSMSRLALESACSKWSPALIARLGKAAHGEHLDDDLKMGAALRMLTSASHRL